MKHGAHDLGYELKEVMRLRPVFFQWNHQNDGKLNLGLIAQEVKPVLPELVEKGADKDGTSALNYTGLMPVLIKAVQEQQVTIEKQQVSIQEQKTALEQKETEIKSLNARLTLLEQALERMVKQDNRNQK